MLYVSQIMLQNVYSCLLDMGYESVVF